jgi:hypothetical protein
MTIEQLLEKSSDELATMSDDEIRAFFLPMLNVSRPTEKLSSRTKLPGTTTISKKDSGDRAFDALMVLYGDKL